MLTKADEGKRGIIRRSTGLFGSMEKVTVRRVDKHMAICTFDKGPNRGEEIAVFLDEVVLEDVS